MSSRKYIDGIISKKDAPSGGNFDEYCKNSALFKERVCKQDNKPYENGEICPCFCPPPEKPNLAKED
jgi:hypothetical protein